MEFEQIWGTGHELTMLQMVVRAISIFPIAWVLIRISGRRSFGFGAPLDNVIVILLGALLSRAIVGASPFFPVIGACLAIVVLHRIATLLAIRYHWVSNLINGKKILLYKNRRFFRANMHRALISEEDILQEVRQLAQLESLEEVEAVYMERDGEISIIKKP